jgi:2',3'-cyclic-nucleotide 2'-phosphodiesterase (5'-nucleotidase family)
VGADLALLNGGSIRSGLKSGTIILDDVYSVLPFDDKVVKLRLKGNDIKYALERSLQLPENSGGKLQHHGIEMTIESGKVAITKINGRPFELDKDYWVATGEFLASGGDGYKIFEDKSENRIDSGLMIRDLLVNFIENKTIVTQEDVEKLN